MEYDTLSLFVFIGLLSYIINRNMFKQFTSLRKELGLKEYDQEKHDKETFFNL